MYWIVWSKHVQECISSTCKQTLSCGESFDDSLECRGLFVSLS